MVQKGLIQFMALTSLWPLLLLEIVGLEGLQGKTNIE